MRIKKFMYMCLGLAVITFMTGCQNGANTSGRATNASNGVEEVLQAQMADSAGKDGEEAEIEGAVFQSGTNAIPSKSNGQAILSQTEGIDIDLTSLSSTMVYSEVFNMMYMPEDYVGKTVKMDGLFATYHDEITGNYYFACIIQDAAACCAQGMEFVLTEEYSYPEDYPEEGGEITVIGVFDTYEEGEYTYCTLRNAKML